MLLPESLSRRKSTCSPRCAAIKRKGRGNPKVRIHGLSDSPTAWVWADMKRRCMSPHRRGYENYGGRGIAVCSRWLIGDGIRNGFECFVEDLGVRPSKQHQLDRIDNDGNYEPSNCRWVDRNEQNYKKRNTVVIKAFGKFMNLSDAEVEYGLPKTTIYQRIFTKGLSPELALTTPHRLKRLR